MAGFCQDPQFSQFYSNPLYLGPSFAGAVEGSRFAAAWRDQWIQATAVFRARSISYDHYFSTFNSGLGVLLFQDVSGTSGMGSTNISLNYSYNFKVYNVWYIRPGLSFSYVEHGFYGDLLFGDEILHLMSGGSGNFSSAHPPARGKARDIDAGSSLLVYTKKFWMGTTVDHMLTPSIELYELEADIQSIIPVKVSCYGGYEFRRRGKLLRPSDETMTFAFMYKQQRSSGQLDIGVYWHHSSPLVLGLWYRGIPIVNSQRGDAVVMLVGIDYRQWTIGYSYDLTISNLIGAVHGSHEITASFKFLLPKRNKRGAVPCPAF